MLRRIVEIDEVKCNGCGLCIKACHEGAIELVDGKARLISDIYCDGLGDCLPECPTGAIQIIEREALEYDDEAVQRLKLEKSKSNKTEHSLPCGCPGSAARTIERKPNISIKAQVKAEVRQSTSELSQWPVQIKLIHPHAPYLQGAELLVAADCTAYAYANFHSDFIKGRITLIGCPKLDDLEYYKEKLAEIIRNNSLKSITVVRMEVPCCGGIVNAVKSAMLEAQVIVPYSEVTIGTDGSIIK
ncbi:ATP-binding protein [Clostridium thermarum]|uniref:ATP-binding protein n=1 Tax=Clostridium thermarum TaxID=1716543 RepID=UPI0013D35052|nr:4Fe-4S dicluster domain-containing protein [Clostridium thermarum]